MCVGVFFAVMKAHAVLGNEGAQGVKHVARHIGIGVFVDSESGGGVLREKQDDALTHAGLLQLFSNQVSELNQLLTLARLHVQNVHLCWSLCVLCVSVLCFLYN